jgi:uncharacterized membrane protein YjgN (DUF898 family)
MSLNWNNAKYGILRFLLLVVALIKAINRLVVAVLLLLRSELVQGYLAYEPANKRLWF